MTREMLASRLSDVLKDVFREVSRKGYRYALEIRKNTVVSEGVVGCDGQIVAYHTELLWMDEFRESRLKNEGEAVDEHYHLPKEVAHVAIMVVSEELTICADVFLRSDDIVYFFNEIYVPTLLPEGKERHIGWLV